MLTSEPDDERSLLESMLRWTQAPRYWDYWIAVWVAILQSKDFLYVTKCSVLGFRTTRGFAPEAIDELPAERGCQLRQQLLASVIGDEVLGVALRCFCPPMNLEAWWQVHDDRLRWVPGQQVHAERSLVSLIHVFGREGIRWQIYPKAGSRLAGMAFRSQRDCCWDLTWKQLVEGVRLPGSGYVFSARVRLALLCQALEVKGPVVAHRWPWGIDPESRPVEWEACLAAVQERYRRFKPCLL